MRTYLLEKSRVVFQVSGRLLFSLCEWVIPHSLCPQRRPSFKPGIGCTCCDGFLYFPLSFCLFHPFRWNRQKASIFVQYCFLIQSANILKTYCQANLGLDSRNIV
jgi:hypothetical protein